MPSFKATFVMRSRADSYEEGFAPGGRTSIGNFFPSRRVRPARRLSPFLSGFAVVCVKFSYISLFVRRKDR